MKVNFKKFPCYMGIKKDKKIEVDVSESLAESIYTNVPGIAAHHLAEKIYASDGEVELDEREVEMLLTTCKPLFTGVFFDSLKDYFKKEEV